MSALSLRVDIPQIQEEQFLGSTRSESTPPAPPNDSSTPASQVAELTPITPAVSAFEEMQASLFMKYATGPLNSEQVSEILASTDYTLYQLSPSLYARMLEVATSITALYFENMIDVIRLEQLCCFFTKLNVVCFTKMTLTSQHLAQIATIRNLTSIQFSRCQFVGEDPFQSFGQTATLDTLVVDHCEGFTDRSLELFAARASRLRSLWIKACAAITARGYAHISSFSRLRDLGLTCQSTLTDTVLEELASRIRTTVRNVTLRNNSAMTDGGLRWIAILCEKLQVLNVSDSPTITNKGIRYFFPVNTAIKHLIHLNWIKIVNCPSISDDLVAHFQARAAQVTFIR